jgi:predicted nucleotide-binding protein (sugar kinase/HSP70/actin superfamily)
LKIGIPRALLYYWYGSIWEQFWHDCGYEVITSPATNHRIMKTGVESALDELCLPMKIFLGHVRILAPDVDWIMIPHLIKVQRDAFICPKFMGLPDIVRHALPDLHEKLLTVQVGPRQVDMLASLQRSMRQTSQPLKMSKNDWRNLKSHYINMLNLPSLQIIEACRCQGKNSDFSGLGIGLLGHPYCLYDACLNLNLLQFLTDQGAYFLTPEMIPVNFKGVGSAKLSKKLFWTTGEMQFDALEWMLHSSASLCETEIDGFIQIAPFACGPEAIVSDMLERRIKEVKKPYLKIYYEEHSGEAGVITRLEAFLDLIKYRHIAC